MHLMYRAQLIFLGVLFTVRAGNDIIKEDFIPTKRAILLLK